MSVSDNWFYSVKAAQRDLVKLCGTIERAAGIANVSKTQMGRFVNATDPDLMPLHVIVVLEKECGQPVVTQVMAAEQGRRLTDPDEERQVERDVMTGYAALMQQSASVVNALASAMADGQVTPVEAQGIDRALSAMQIATQDLRAALAGVKARGGVKASLSVVSGEGA